MIIVKARYLPWKIMNEFHNLYIYSGIYPMYIVTSRSNNLVFESYNSIVNFGSTLKDG